MNIPALVLAIGFGLFFGYGVSLYIFAGLLDRSNNMGDTLCNFDHYCPGEIHYERMADNVSKDSKDSFIREYGVDPVDEPDKKVEITDDEAQYEDIPDIDIPIFKPLE